MLCPRCESDEILVSRRRGLESYFIPVSPLIRYRCKDCWHRFWGFRNRRQKSAYLSLLGAISLLALLLLITFVAIDKFPAKSSSRTPPEIRQSDTARASTRMVDKPIAMSRVTPSATEGQGDAGENVNTVAVTTGKTLAIYKNPSRNAPIIGRGEANRPVTVMHTYRDWVVVKLSDGTVGWALRNNLETGRRGAAPPAPEDINTDPQDDTVERLVVDVDIARVRKAPSQKALILARTVRGDQVTVLGIDKDWFRIRLENGLTGWAHRSLFRAP